MHRWQTVSATSGLGASANWPPWRTRQRKRSQRWRRSTTAICSTIPCSLRGRCPASMWRTSRWPRAAPGHCRYRISMAPTTGISRSMRVWRRPSRALPNMSIGMFMNAALPDFRDEELLSDVIARLIGDVRHVAVGNASPIPAAAALLARERNGNGRPYVSLLQSRKHNFFTDGARELFDCAGQGRVDVFFLSGGQIDGQGNINLVSTGDYAHPQVRFPGSFGSTYLYYVVRKVIVFRTGWPIALVTNRCLFSFACGRFALTSVHPGHTVEEVIEHTGFDFARAEKAPETPAPSLATLKLLREVVAPQLAEVYPRFAAQVFGVDVPVSVDRDTSVSPAAR